MNYSDHNELLGYRRLDKLQEPFNLFLINGTVNSIILPTEEPEWSGNIKKAIGSALQIHGDKPGAFVVNEVRYSLFFYVIKIRLIPLLLDLYSISPS